MNSIITLAGFMKERHLWMMLRDISQSQNRVLITPYNIVWDGERFVWQEYLMRNEQAKPFLPRNAGVDEPNRVWTLGATTFHLFMGCNVFNGLGGAAQNASSPLPYMRKTLPELSNIVCQMLSFDDKQRPTMQEICKAAEQNIKRLQAMQPQRKVKVKPQLATETIKDFWQDEF